MLDRILRKEWRETLKDDFDRGYVFNWFCIDHVGFFTNPRRRAVGYHTIFEHYKSKMREYKCEHDELGWHFHPVSLFREGHRSTNNYSYTNEHLQVLSRRVIDHGWFPSIHRPGLHTERPDINFFLEQWIPFDYANQRMEEDKNADLQMDISAGRFGDWRRATSEWEVYHPDFYDYQIPGNMKRYIARCLNVNARLRMITPEEVEKAFVRANKGLPTIMSVTDHDEREMAPYIERYYGWVREIQTKYPEVKIKNAGAAEAMRESLNIPFERATELDCRLEENLLTIKTDKDIWGPQPYFCFKTLGDQYIHENLDFHGENHWSFTFDADSIPLSRLAAIGVATNDNFGNATVWTENLREV